jgi:hypothetical protein
MYFSKGNHKLSKNVLIWNLPRLTTCPGAGACKDWCYEIKIERMYKNTRPCREQNLRESKKIGFTSEVMDYLQNRKEKYVRIHESGDFYSQEYFDKWWYIALLMKKKVFYTYTKSFNLYLGILPYNFHVIQSYGSKWDEKIDPAKSTFKVMPKGIIPNKGEFLCPGKGCGDTCLMCMSSGPKHIVVYQH